MTWGDSGGWGGGEKAQNREQDGEVEETNLHCFTRGKAVQRSGTPEGAGVFIISRKSFSFFGYLKLNMLYLQVSIIKSC